LKWLQTFSGLAWNLILFRRARSFFSTLHQHNHTEQRLLHDTSEVKLL